MPDSLQLYRQADAELARLSGIDAANPAQLQSDLDLLLRIVAHLRAIAVAIRPTNGEITAGASSPAGTIRAYAVEDVAAIAGEHGGGGGGGSLSLISQAAAEGGTEETARSVSGLRLKQAFDAYLAAWVGAAPGALNTLDELAAALSDDANFASTMTTALAGKLNSSAVSAFMLTLLDDANAAAAANTLGVQPIVRQTMANADVTISAGTTQLVNTTTLTGARTVTLPAASGYAAGTTLAILDQTRSITTANWINVVRAGSDTVQGGTSYALYGTGVRGVILRSDGASAWSVHSAPIELNGAYLYRLNSGRLTLGSFDGITLEGNIRVLSGDTYCSSFLEFSQIASGGTVNNNSARIYAKDVAGTTEIFVKDEAGNETQISPHSATAPDWLYQSGTANPAEEVSYSANEFRGVVTHHHRLTNRVYVETFAEYNERMALTEDRALLILDWDEVQAAHVAGREAERADWQVRRGEWEALPEGERPEWTGGEIPAVYVAKGRPDWAEDQSASILAGRAAEAIEATFRAAIATGHCITPEGWCIAMDEPDIQRWVAYLVELREREALPEGDPNRVTVDSDIPFLDLTGTVRTVKLPRAREIFLAAGAAWKTAFFTKAQALAALP
jgi:hypothetical protein